MGLLGKKYAVVVGFVFVLFCCGLVFGQESGWLRKDAKDKEASIGGVEHEMNIYGVKIGMDIPTALKAVFDNAKRKPGQEKPDSLKKEGKKKEDIRVLYNNLPKGSLQLVFAKGKYVKEIVLIYESRPTIEALRLASSSDIGVASSGERYDDRYTIGFVDSKKQEKLWWRDEKSGNGYDVRLSFRSGNVLRDGQLWWQTVSVKLITVLPGHEKKFSKAFTLKSK